MEADVLRKETLGNKDLNLDERCRLLARVEIYRLQPPKLTGLKPTIERMNSEMRLGVIDFLLALVYANRVVAPGEVKVMEKIYALFGLDSSALYTRLHQLSAGTSTTVTTSPEVPAALRLDAAKIEQLKSASAEVSKKLAAIFQDQDDNAPQEKLVPEASELGSGNEPGLLGLDPEHAALLAVLVSRAQWTRAEFDELCVDKGLMPDGAIERINDAAFAKHDQPLIEGEDPLEIGVSLLETT
jgi:hypothetical protein